MPGARQRRHLVGRRRRADDGRDRLRRRRGRARVPRPPVAVRRPRPRARRSAARRRRHRSTRPSASSPTRSAVTPSCSSSSSRTRSAAAATSASTSPGTSRATRSAATRARRWRPASSLARDRRPPRDARPRCAVSRARPPRASAAARAPRSVRRCPDGWLDSRDLGRRGILRPRRRGTGPQWRLTAACGSRPGGPRATTTRMPPASPPSATARSATTSRATARACCTRAALRRLAAKTQVLSPASPADFARNRLTHSLEVAQVGRELATALRLSPDVVDTACLSHDLGHPPFGHNGERALNDWAEDIGGFEGNAQTLRILTRLEPKVLDDDGRSLGPEPHAREPRRDVQVPVDGRAPAARSRAGASSSASTPTTRTCSAGCAPGAPGRVRCIEAEVMDLSDDIAYSVHDFEDAIVNGYLDPARLATGAEHEALLGRDPVVGRASTSPATSSRTRSTGSCGCRSGSTRSTAPAASLARLKNLTSRPDRSLRPRGDHRDARGVFRGRCSPATARTSSCRGSIEAEMAVLKGIIGAVVVSIDGRKSVYKEQRRVLKRLGDGAVGAARTRSTRCTRPTSRRRRRMPRAGASSSTRSRASPTSTRSPGTAGSSARWTRHPSASGRPDRSRPDRARGERALMAGRILQADVDEVKARTNIADIVGERVALKSAGVGVDEGPVPVPRRAQPELQRAPAGRASTTASAAASRATCTRSCGRWTTSPSPRPSSGSPARIGYTLHYEDGGAAPETTGRARLYAANGAAAEFFRAQLATPEAETGPPLPRRARLRCRRGRALRCRLRAEGLVEPARRAAQQGFSDDELTAAGLVSQGQRGVYDRFRGRVVWPIRDVTGQIIGFGARKLLRRRQGPEVPQHPRDARSTSKSQVLYGLDLAKRDISRDHRVVVVEGYTDVMACHLAGITTAIATCGTAFGVRSHHGAAARDGRRFRRRRGRVHLRPGRRRPEGRAARLRRREALRRADLRRRRAGRPRPVRPAPAARRRRRARAHGHEGADVRVRDRPAARRLRPRHRGGSRRGAARCGADRRRDPRPARCGPGTSGCSRAGSGSTSARCARRSSAPLAARRGSPGDEPAVRVAGRPRPGAAEPLVRVTIASLPRTAEVALERDALMGLLQFGHRLDPALLTRSVAVPFRHPALEAVRQAIAGRARREPPGLGGGCRLDACASPTGPWRPNC